MDKFIRTSGGAIGTYGKPNYKLQESTDSNTMPHTTVSHDKFSSGFSTAIKRSNLLGAGNTVHMGPRMNHSLNKNFLKIKKEYNMMNLESRSLVNFGQVGDKLF